MNTPHVDTESLGFPTGYFSIKSVATGRLLDVFRNDTADSSPIGLWPATEQSLVESASAGPYGGGLPPQVARRLLNR